jgi:mannose-6-phosphate isomerase-like protein (cupin superfamily)
MRTSVVLARKVMRMEWPSAASVGDAVIVRQDPSSGSRFVVHGSNGVQSACSSYAEAEALAAAYTEHTRANVWYVENGRLQLVCSFDRVHARDREHMLNETLAPDRHK